MKPDRYAPRAVETQLGEHRAVKELSKAKAEHKGLIRELEDARARMSVLNSLEAFAPQPIVRRETTSGLREATAVVLCSDWHVEEPVLREKVNGLNEYDITIAGQRVNRLIDGVLWLLEMHRAKFQIKDLVLWLGGDLFSGYIHEELVETAQLSPVECVLWLHERLIGMIDTFLERGDLDTIHVPCSFGNHGRTTLKKRISTGAENSYEWLMYQQIAFHYRNEPRVKVIAPRSILLYLPVYDRVIRFTHGDATKYMGGVGGLGIPLNKAISAWNQGHRADVTCLGHYHTYMPLPHLAANGSLIGYNSYAVEIKAPYEPPQQSYFLIDSKRGKCGEHPIWVGESNVSGE